MTQLQKQLTNLTKNDSPPVVTNQSADKISGHSIDILLSPPDSRPSIVDVSECSVSAFSDIHNIATPTKQTRLTAEVPGQNELNAPVRDVDGGTAHRASHAIPVQAPDATASSADPLQDNFTFVQNELDALRTRMMDFDDRVGEIDVRVDGQDVTLEELSKSTATLTESVNGNVVRKSKQIKKLNRKVKTRVPASNNWRWKCDNKCRNSQCLCTPRQWMHRW